MPKLPTSRLMKSLKYIDMCLSSRELSYESIPYVIAAEHLLKLALELNNKGAERA